jgi:hypothetical protein
MARSRRNQLLELELHYIFCNQLLLGLKPIIEVPTFGSSFLLPKLIGALTNTLENIDRHHITFPTRIKINNTHALSANRTSSVSK